MEKIPFIPIAVLFSLLVFGIGVFLFRRKTEQSAAWLLVVCCFSFVVTFILMASVGLAAALPFIVMTGAHEKN
jgi:hypothetical protein